MLPAAAKKPSSKVAETNGDVAQRRLVVQNAARDGRTGHFDFTLKELCTIWASKGKVADSGSSSKEIFAIKELKDLGTVEAGEQLQASLGKGKPATKKIVVLSRNSSRASSASFNCKSSSTNKATLRVSSAASTGYRATSPSDSIPRSPVKSNKHGDKRAGSVDMKTTNHDAKVKGKDAKIKERLSKLPALVEQEEESNASTDPNLSDESFAREESDGCDQIGDTDGAPPRKGKPKSADYEGSDAELLEATISKYSPLVVRTWQYCVRKLGYKASRKRITIRKICASQFLLKSFIPGELPIREKKKRKSKKREADSEDGSGEDLVDNSIDQDRILGYYNIHLTSLKNLRKGDAAITEKLWKDLWKAGLTYAKFKSPVKSRNNLESSDDGVITVERIVQGRQLAKSAGQSSASALASGSAKDANSGLAQVSVSRKAEVDSNIDTDGSLNDNAFVHSTSKATRPKFPGRSEPHTAPARTTPSVARCKDTPSKLVIDSVTLTRSLTRSSVRPKLKLSCVESTPTKVAAPKAPRDHQNGKYSEEDMADDESEDGEKGMKGHKGGSERRVEDEHDGNHGTHSDRDSASNQRGTNDSKPRPSPRKHTSVTKNGSPRKKCQANGEDEAVPVERAGTYTKRRKYIEE
ncbi:hypothetical protein FRC09_006051 [Ceratobasidium sp. 395]|nr:hypothetical protein FRC09_006051 [Ceratobasidium sp. 395]